MSTDPNDLPPQGLLRKLTGVQVIGAGSYVPDNVVTNEAMCQQLGFDPDWIIRRTGIKERRHAPASMTTSDMAVEAAQRCLAAAGVPASEVDLLILGTFTPDMPFPATACTVQHRMGIIAPAMDIQAACAGFMYAMITAMQFVAAGTAKRALVIGADTNSRILDPKDYRTYPLFGDGAGAVLLAPGSSEQGFHGYTLGSDGSGGPLLCRPMGGAQMPPTAAGLEDSLQYLKMDGKAVFKWACKVLNETILSVLGHAGLTLDDVSLFITHQANIRIIHAATDTLDIDRKKVFVNLDKYGNTSAGSIPICLDEALASGQIQRGQNILLSGFGAGLLWGTGVFRW